MPSDQLLGPLALLVGALVAVGALWREHLKADADDRDQRDRAVAVSEAQVAATRAVADGFQDIKNEIAAIRRDAAARKRREDL